MTNPINLDAIQEKLNKQLQTESGKELSNESANASASRMEWERALDLIWIKLAEMYSARFYSQEGEDPSKWAALSSMITLKQIKHGYQQLNSITQEWPPNMVQFKNLCLDIELDRNGKPVKDTHTAAHNTYDNPHKDHGPHTNDQKARFSETMADLLASIPDRIPNRNPNPKAKMSQEEIDLDIAARHAWEDRFQEKRP